MPGRTSFTIAPARAGKSTFWQRWLKEPDQDGLNRVVLCRDVWRLAYYGERFNASRERGMHDVFDVSWRALHGTGDYHIGLDETNCSVRSIRNILRLDPYAIPYFINTSIDVCKERAYASEQPDLVEKGVIDRMFINLITLCNYKKHPQLCTNAVVDFMIYESVEKIRQEVLEEKECQVPSDR